jgi:16S rRNA (adenine1518-N6/adenine1519-N6)-dimethyltransferase
MAAKKSLSQNFLVNSDALQAMHDLIDPKAQDLFVEIGPGKGALTEQVLPHVQQLIAVELDSDLLPSLKKRFAVYGDRFRLLHHDALAYDFSQVTQGSDFSHFRLIGNLPYHITGPLIFHCLQYVSLIEDIHFMLQKEVVMRLVALPGSSEYGRLSVMVQYFCKAELCLLVMAACFKPRPAVDSAVVRLLPHQTLPVVADDFSHFELLVRTAFQKRRKQMVNAVAGVANRDALQEAGLDAGSMRPQDCSVADFVRLSNVVVGHKAC